MKGDRRQGWFTTAATVLAGCLLAVAAPTGCDRPGDPPPIPSLDAVEPLVERRIRDALQALDDDPTAGAWGGLGEIYDVHDFTAEAIACYAQASALDPEDWRWPYFGGILLRNSDQAAATRRFELAAGLKPDYAPIPFYLGVGLYQAEDLERAEEAFRRALALDPGQVNARIGLARVALARGNPEAAIGPLEQALELAPEEAAVHGQLATVYRALGRQERADDAEAAARSASRRPQPGGMAALIDPVREEVVLRQGASLEWLRAGTRFLLSRQRGEDALASWDDALAVDPDSPAHLVESARLLVRLDRADQARERLDRAAQLAPDDPEVHAVQGDMYAARGDVSAAVGAYRRALELDPGRHDVRTRLARLLLESGRVEQGLRALRDAVEARPDNADLRYNLSEALSWSGDDVAAVASAREALAIDPDHPQTRLLLRELARERWRSRRFEEALDAYRLAAGGPTERIALSRDLAWALATCPVAGLRNGREALEISRELAERSGYRDPQVLDALAAAQAESGDFDGARTTADAAIALVEETLGDTRDPARRQRLETVLRQLQARRALYAGRRPYHAR